jgi:signal transduction histidine kinase
MLARLRFETKARIAYVLPALVLVAGTAFAVRRATALSERQVGRLRGDEGEITLVERLRWNSELIVSDGRGYLISAEPRLLAALRAAEKRFDANVRALHSMSLSAANAALVTETQDDAARFRAVQAELLLERQTDVDPTALEQRFEAELVPLRQALDASVDRLVDYQQATLAASYAAARAERRNAELTLYALLAALAASSLVIAHRFSARLGRAYGKEREALEIARKALAARDDVMGMVAHDLRNPLGAILMKTEVMAADSAAPDKFRRSARSIENAGRRMEHLIRSMLDLTTLEAGRFTITCEPCDVDALVEDASELFAGLAASKRLELDRRIDPPGLRVCADRERVLQVLSNLFGNAAKFSPPGGTVTLEVRRDVAAASFTVIDEGPGIPVENVPHLFERYWKDESGGTKGTGLGLFIAKGIVEAHGGTIGAANEPDHGARFTFTIPLVTDEPPARARVV